MDSCLQSDCLVIVCSMIMFDVFFCAKFPSDRNFKFLIIKYATYLVT